MDLAELVRAVVSGDALSARQWVIDHGDIRWSEVERPAVADPPELAIAAGLAELLAARVGQAPPPWTAGIGAVDEPIFLVRAAASLPRFRRRIEQESPEPLKRRRLLAPADFLIVA